MTAAAFASHEVVTPQMLALRDRLPTLLDLIVKGRLDGHTLVPGDLALFASVGAGMHINAFLYRMPA